MKKIYLWLVIILINVVNIYGQCYDHRFYVDSENGVDLNTGKKDCNGTIHPWKTINKINEYLVSPGFNGGDTISFRSGQRFLVTGPVENLDNITFNSYGTGARPNIDGQGSQSAFNLSGDNIHFYNLRIVNCYKYAINLWIANNFIIDQCSIDSTVATNPDYAVALYIGFGNNGNVKNSFIGNTQGVDDHGQGIYIDGADNLLVEHDTLENNPGNLRIAFGTHDPPNYDSSDHANNWTDNLIVRYCILRGGVLDNIGDDGSYYAQFYYNLFESTDATTYHPNVYIHSDGSHDYNMFTCIGAKYYNNTFIQRNSSNIVELSTDYEIIANNLTFKNNLFYYDNPGSPFFYHTWNDPVKTFTFDNNLWYATNSNHSWVANNITYSNFTDWHNAGYDVHGIYNQPLFNNYSYKDYSLQPNSPATLAGVNVGLTQDITGKAVGNPPDIGAYQNSTYWSGTTSANDTMRGNVAITGNLTVPSNRTLTILPETHIKVENGANITVNGTLNCQYNSSQGNITIDTILTNNQKGSIIFDGSSASSSVLQHVSMRQGAGIQCLNGANVLIKNSRLDTCTLGIYIYSSAPQIIQNTIYNPLQNAISGIALNLSPIIKGNVMTKVTNQHEWEGIYLINGTYPFVLNNDIRYFDFGIYIGGGSACYFYDTDGTTPNPNNRFRNNVTGICSGWGSTIWAGNDANADSGCFNTILNNSTAAKSYEYSGLYAWHNYWGPENNLPPYFYIDGNSFIQWDNHLASDPWDQGNSVQNKPGGPLASNNHLSKSVTGDNLYTGIQLEKDGKIDDAISFYKNLIANDTYVRIALSQLSHIKYKYSKNELTSYFGTLLTIDQKYYSTVKKILGDIYLQNDQFDNAMTAYDDVIKNYSTEYDGISARFSKLFAYLHIKKDPTTASQILSEIKGLKSDEAEVQMNIKIVEGLIDGTNKVLGKKTILSNDNIPKTYGLSQNYPNPFNPSTTIRYQIPKPGLVTLKVYDILGKEVATLVNENMIEGSYDYSFNAAKFPSGVYIYQLRVNDYVSSKKMIMLK